MMDTREEEVVRDEQPPRKFGVLLAKGALACALLITLAYLVGYSIGTAGALIEESAGSGAFIVGLGLPILGCLALVWGLFRLRLWERAEDPVAPKQKRARGLILASLAIGMVLGVVLVWPTFSGGGPLILFSDAPLPAASVAIFLAVWLVLTPLLTWIWWRAIDEHEARAYEFGSLVAIHVYLFAAPAWWFGWRGGFLPEPRHMLIFLAVMLALCLGWAWRRYR
jgi:hypothetical protein